MSSKTETDSIIIQIAPKFDFLMRPAPFKVMYGGRGGAKSISVGRTLAIMGAQRKLRWLCARETMASLKQSSYFLLKNQIQKMGLPGYEFTKDRIYNLNGTEFTFAGLKGNEQGIKSYEALDGVWVEEAANVSQDSWDALLPTVRKKKAEVWVTFNPLLETDPTYQIWVLNPPPGTVCVKVGWEDNPWFTEMLRVQKDHMLATDPVKYRHIWGGECRSAVEGAVFAREMAQAEDEGRITEVPYNRAHPVHTIWDLGFGDMTAIWFAQAYGGRLHFIDYEEGNGKTIQEWLIICQQKGYLYGEDWLPHDGVDGIIHTKLTSDPSMSPELLMRNAGRKVRIVVKMLVTSRINAARTVFPTCRFDKQKCSKGLHALRMYQWGPPTEVRGNGGTKILVEPTKPLHDRFSHGADAFSEAAVCLREAPAEEIKKKRIQYVDSSGYSPFA
jgi:phage terminase large subunit